MLGLPPPLLGGAGEVGSGRPWSEAAKARKPKMQTSSSSMPESRVSPCSFKHAVRHIQ